MDNQDRVAEATRAVNTRIGFFIHLTVFALVNGLLVVVNLTTSRHYLWFIWPLLGWGAGIGLHAFLAYALPRMAGVRHRMIEKELRQRTDPKSSTAGRA
jgi:2TM domain